jgi:hypothetical protein
VKKHVHTPSIKLDAEIDYYRKLLDGEYTRLSMPNSPATSTKALLKRSAVWWERSTLILPIASSLFQSSSSATTMASVSASAKAAASAIKKASARYSQKVQSERVYLIPTHNLPRQVSTSGSVAIDDIDTENGYYVTIRNVTGDNVSFFLYYGGFCFFQRHLSLHPQVTITGWTLKVSNGSDDSTFKFPAR